VIGIDPSSKMLALAKRFTPSPLAESIHYQLGAAEDLPVPDGMADIVWAVGSAHHWRDVPTGLRECRRVCGPGAKLLVVERSVRPGARGHAAHGLTAERADAFAGQVFDAGFARVGTETIEVGRHRFVVVHGRLDP
jgi:ubiquinone/menaquinone biosynthesis C-methylase UbiE